MIFVVLALVWAVVLIPKALRHHDEVAKTRPVEEVSDKGRVLHRRGRAEVPDVVAPTATDAPIPAPTSEPATPRRRGPDGRARLEARRAAARAAARRRRRILTVLLLADLVTVVGAVVLLVPVWSPAVPLALTLVYLVLCRTLVKREHAGWDAEVRRAGRRAEAAATPQPEVIEPAPTEVSSTAQAAEPAALVARNEQGLAVVDAGEDTASYDAAQLRDAALAGAPGSLWDPLPVTLPTYVTKPRATRTVRTIDLREPGVSSSGRDAADSALVAGQGVPAVGGHDGEAEPPRAAVGS